MYFTLGYLFCAVVQAGTTSVRVTIPDTTRDYYFLIAIPPLTKATSVVIKSIAPETLVSDRDELRTANCEPRTGLGGLTGQGFANGRAYAEITIHPLQPLEPRGFIRHRALALTVEYEPLSLDDRLQRESLWAAAGRGAETVQPLNRSVVTHGHWAARPLGSVPIETTLAPLFGGPPPPDFRLTELEHLPLQSEVIIVPNIGGWGNVPLEQAQDLLPTVLGLRQLLASHGMTSVVVPYYRNTGSAPNGLSALTEMLGIHHTVAREQAREIERLLAKQPGLRIILVGLSNGATIVDATMNILDSTFRKRVYALAVGTPFWRELTKSDNILHILGDGHDPLANGDVDVLLANILVGAVRVVRARLNGRRPKFEEMFHVQGHDYTWDAVRPRVAQFFEKRWAESH